MKKVLFYTVYERIWHWAQALAVLVLLLTGFEIAYGQFFSVTGFKTAVTVHNFVGLMLVINAFLALFYNVSSGLMHRYIPGVSDFFMKGFEHASYYAIGIFKGDPHPFDKTPEKRLLPLQKVTYFMILNVLLPLMTITGLLKWSARIDPRFIEMFGGLSLLGPVHRFGAWLFLSFLIGHVYMSTTGHTPLANMISMIRGYEYIETADEEE
ncbi:MAG: cytochrome b/b6 domain-containing protein [Deltaproteobacteria bacterium]|nr:cytochrome b/b6 domain-containing protein [Deltaproteobacteria bacterium]